MTATTFERALILVLTHEGGWSDDPPTRGRHEFRRHDRHAEPVARPAGDAGRGAGADTRDRRPALPAPVLGRDPGRRAAGGLDYALFDFAVNSGPRRAVIGLQRALGIADDGGSAR